MIIKEIELISFGKFKNKIINFNDSFNVIGGDNESGKTTIMDFIYIMFYGFGDNRGKGLSLREHYKPWNGDSCEGKMTVQTSDGKELTIYRKAASLKKNDICMVYDTKLGTEIKINPETLLSIAPDTFKKTLCISQLLTVNKGESIEIAQKLSNISSFGEEDSDYNKAITILESLRREIKPLRGSGGELSKIDDEINEALRNEELIKEHNTKIISTQTDLENAKKDLAEAKAKNELLKEKAPNDEALKLSGRIEEKEIRYNEQIELINQKNKDYASFKSEFNSKNIQEKPQSKLTSLFIFLAILCALFSFLFVYMLVPCLIFITIFIVLNNKNKNQLKDNNEIIAFRNKDALFKEDINKDNELLSSLRTELDALKEKLSVLNNELLKEESEKRKAQEEYLYHSQTVASLESVLEHLKTSRNIDKNYDINELTQRRDNLKKSLKAIEIVIKALNNAHNEMQRSFTPALNTKASEYFSKITAEKYNSIHTDENFNINVLIDIPRDSSHFSGGTIDQMYLSLRMALCDMMFDEKIFVLLDQPFIQYDKIRKTCAVSMLKELSENKQIILFTSDIDIEKTEMLT
ncbi:MAG: AAA family ATPase [Clostridia bacterium]|nr:AAA family ATPase [Clostridia bacterium]